MSAGQILNVVVCSATDIGTGNGKIAGPVTNAICPDGQNTYVVTAYVPLSTSQSIFDGLALSFDPEVAGGIFSFAFGLVVFFWLLGLKGSVLLRPFWGRRL